MSLDRHEVVGSDIMPQNQDVLLPSIVEVRNR